VQEKLWIPDEAMGYSSFPRNHTALINAPWKRDFLIADLASMCNGSLPHDGRMNIYRRDPSHLDLGNAAGRSREAWTRLMSRVRGAMKHRDGTPKKQAVPRPLLHSKRRPGHTNIYTPALPGHEGIEWVVYRISDNKPVRGARFSTSHKVSEPFAKSAAFQRCQEMNRQAGKEEYDVRGRILDNKQFFYASAQQLLDHKEWSGLFDPELLRKKDGEDDFSGNADIPNWVWHPCLDLTATARLALSYYFMAGIEHFGAISPWQGTMVRRLGISPGTITRANRELESKGIVRVIGTAEEVHGAVFKRKNKVIYLPWWDLQPNQVKAEVQGISIKSLRLMLHKARAAAHRQRTERRRVLRGLQLDHAQKEAQTQKRLWLSLQFCRATRISRQVLVAHLSKSVRIHTLFAAISGKMFEAGVDSRVAGALIPRIKGPP
jgi:hypothetical protein